MQKRKFFGPPIWELGGPEDGNFENPFKNKQVFMSNILETIIARITKIGFPHKVMLLNMHAKFEVRSSTGRGCPPIWGGHFALSLSCKYSMARVRGGTDRTLAIYNG